MGTETNAGGDFSTALGYRAAAPGLISIALGGGANANQANSIVLNAANAFTASAAPGSFVVKPVRGLASGASLAYDTTTGEISYMTSSRRYKTDIIGVSDAAAERVIDGLRPVSFRSLFDVAGAGDGSGSGGSSPRYYGFVAEEVAKVDPLLVYTRRRSSNSSETAGGGGNGSPQEAEEEVVEGVHYERVVPILVQEVGRLKREHSRDLEALRTANWELERAKGEHARDLEALRTANRELDRADGEHARDLEALRTANGELERANGEHARDLEALRTANGELERRLRALESLFA